MADRPLVALASCRHYDPAEVSSALAEALSHLGGMAAFVTPGARVFVKVNLLKKASPERAVTTHPELVRAVVRAAWQAGAADVAVGDSPGGMTTTGMFRSLCEEAGLRRVCAEEGARLALLDTDVVRVANPRGKLFTAFDLGREAVEADVLVNVPKLKTHGFMLLTGGVKNLFGLVPGIEKARFHMRVPDRAAFADMLVDIALARTPELTVMDGVVAMEGQGPGSGDPTPFGAILASADVFALDVVTAALVRFEPGEVYTVAAARARGLAPPRESDIATAGADPEGFARERFAKPPRPADAWFGVRIASKVGPWARTWALPKPYMARGAECTGCETCREACPVGAVAPSSEGRGFRPAFDYDTCIRCYCCQELCPTGALRLRNPWLLGRAGGRGKERR